MVSYLGSLVQFSPGAGRAGLCRELSLCVGSLRRFLAGQPERFGALSPRARRAPSLHGLSEPPVGSQEVFRQEPGPVCQVGGGGFSGAEFSPCPPPCLLPPAGMGRLFSAVSQFLCFANRWRCVPGRLIFPSLSHSLKKLPPIALRAFWPVPTLRNAAGSSPFRPHLLVVGAGVWEIGRAHV